MEPTLSITPSALEKARTFLGTPPKIEILPDTTTENGAPAYSTTGNPGLDLFTLAVRGTPELVCLELFRKAWEQDPTQAVAIAMNLRDIRDGKGERTLVWYILLWLRLYKPHTYLLNLATFVEFGYFKDICQIVKLVVQKESSFVLFQFLELQYFAELLQKDIQAVEEAVETGKVALTLAAKWAPTEGTHFDRKENGNQAYELAKFLFPESKTPQRDYRRQLGVFREHLKVVERLMTEGKWSEIDFGRVPAKAHRLLRTAFGKHQAERYSKYLDDIAAGKAKINVTGTQPHELVSPYLKSRVVDALDRTIEAQWSTMIANLKKKGVLTKALAIVDVSGSMAVNQKLPLRVAVSLGLVVAELTTEPFRGTVITFSGTPELHEVKGDTMWHKVRDISRMHWEMNTNLLNVFDLLLERAEEPEDMIETLFIFTDMQFDNAVEGKWETTYKKIQTKYKRRGYTIPNIVFWNLRSTSAALPVTSDTPGVALLSGFSAELLKVFMEDGDFTPEEIMKQVIKPYLPNVNIYPSEI